LGIVPFFRELNTNRFSNIGAEFVLWRRIKDPTLPIDLQSSYKSKLKVLKTTNK
jgi:hypothetical protein